MRTFTPLSRLRSSLAGERGMALPTAMFAMIAALGLGTVAVVSTVDAQRGTDRDHDSKAAIAAADAGASVALLRLNRYSSVLGGSTPCLAVSGGTLVATSVLGDGWCPAVSGSVGDDTYSYRMTPLVSDAPMTVVTTGTADDVSRRIAIGLEGMTVGNVLEEEGLIGEKDITMSGNADIHVGVGTNGNLTTSGNATICGNIRHGVGKGWVNSGNATQCNGYQVTEGNVSLPPVSSFMPADIATNNSNYRLMKCKATEQPPGCQSDTYNGSWTETSPWNPKTRTIQASGNTILTLGGSDYWICKISLSGNSELIMANGAKVRLFFDTPENCGLPPGAAQISLSGNNRIAATGYEAALGQFDVPGFYLLGSATVATSVNLSGNNVTNEFVLYGPNTTINISGNATYKGVIAGRTINISGNGKVMQDEGFKPPQIGGVTLYSRQSYVECAGATASPPDANC